VSCFWWLLR